MFRNLASIEDIEREWWVFEKIFVPCHKHDLVVGFSPNHTSSLLKDQFPHFGRRMVHQHIKKMSEGTQINPQKACLFISPMLSLMLYASTPLSSSSANEGQEQNLHKKMYDSLFRRGSSPLAGISPSLAPQIGNSFFKGHYARSSREQKARGPWTSLRMIQPLGQSNAPRRASSTSWSPPGHLSVKQVPTREPWSSIPNKSPLVVRIRPINEGFRKYVLEEFEPSLRFWET